MQRDAHGPAHLLGPLVCRVPPILRELPFLLDLQLVPFDRVSAGHEGVVVLAELAERHQDFTVIDDLGHLVAYRHGIRHGPAVHQVPVLQEDGRSFQHVARGDDAGLSGPLDLELRPDGHELVHDVHGGDAVCEGCESRCPRPPVSESESSDRAGVSEDGASCDDVHEVLLLGLDPLGCVGVGLLLIGFVGIQELSDELPSLHTELVDVLLQLGCLLTHPFRDDQAGSSPDPVGLDPGKVPESGYLHLLGAFSVDAHGAVPDDEVDLPGCRGVLQVLALLVERDLLVESGNLPFGGLVFADAQLGPDDVRDEDAHGLTGSSGRTDGSGEDQVDVVRPVRILADLCVGDTFERGDEDTLGENGESDPHGPVQSLLGALGRATGHLPRHHQGDELTVPELGGESADVLRYSLDMIIVEELLHTGCEVLRLGDLNLRERIESFCAGPVGDLVALVLHRGELREVPAHLLAERGALLTHSSSASASLRRATERSSSMILPVRTSISSPVCAEKHNLSPPLL